MESAIRLARHTPVLPDEYQSVDGHDLHFGSSLESEARPYDRLTGVDRTHANSLVRSCDVHPDAIKASRILAYKSLLQCVVTSLPLVVADFFTLWMLLFGVTAFVERAFGLPTGLVTRNTALLAALMILPIAHLAGLYPSIGVSAAVEFRQLVRSAATALCLFAGMGILQNRANWPYFVVSTLLTLCFAAILLPTSRYLSRAFARRCRWWGAPVLVYADSVSVGIELYKRIRSSRDRGLMPAAVVLDVENYMDAASELEEKGIPSFPVQDILECALRTSATWIVVAKSDVANADQEWNEDGAVNASLRAIPNQVLLSSFGGFDCGMWDSTQTIGSSCGLLLANSRHCGSSLFIKRVLDFSLSSLVCLLASPLLVAVAIAIRLSSQGPILYGQKRVGRGGQSFMAWKFRTMIPDADRILNEYLRTNPAARREWDETHKLKNDPRVTWIGRFLRTTSLDELPQLWNILCGEMSLVGPRPIVNSPTYDAAYIRDYPREFTVYKSVRPGLTGMWQVTCRNSGVYEMRIYWDMYYIRNWSLWLDLYIILRTIRTVLLREGSA